MSTNDNDDLQCKNCMKQFSTKSSLNVHKKTAKYCISKQGIDINIANNKFICEYCDKNLVTKHRLTEHMHSCKTKEQHMYTKKIEDCEMKMKEQDKHHDEKMKEKELYILKLEKTIEDLQNKLFELASRPTTSTTTNNNNKIFANMHLITPDHLQEQAKNLTLDHIKRGAIGYGEYFLDHPLKDRVICTDFSRRKLKYKNENGEIVTDPELTNLSELLFKSIKDRNKELTVQYTKELTNRFANKNDLLEVSYFMELATKFSEQDVMVGKMFDGAKNDIFHDIIRHICSKTTIAT